MTLKQLREKADAKLSEFWILLQTKQDAYFAKNGKYFQLLVTDPVVDGVDTIWELRTPSDEKRAIDVNFQFNSPVPFQIQVDEWVGEGNDIGYKAIATVELLDGRIFKRSRDSNQIDTGWFEYIEN